MRIVTVALSFSLLSSLVPATAVADTSQRLTPPKTNLGPSGNAPIFLGVHGQVGKAFDFETEQIGYGAELVFRPGSAADFLSFLYNWNAGMCWQIDYQKISETMSIFSGDCLVRKYVEDMRDEYVSTSAFFGMGFGASRVSFPAGTAGSNNKYWSFLLESGREWTINETFLLWMKAQYRYYDHSGFNYSNWTIQIGAGIPLPW